MRISFKRKRPARRRWRFDELTWRREMRVGSFRLLLLLLLLLLLHLLFPPVLFSPSTRARVKSRIGYYDHTVRDTRRFK